MNHNLLFFIFDLFIILKKPCVNKTLVKMYHTKNHTFIRSILLEKKT